MPRVGEAEKAEKARRKIKNSHGCYVQLLARSKSQERTATSEKRIRVKTDYRFRQSWNRVNQFTRIISGFWTIDRIANGLGIEVRNRQCRALTARATIAGEAAVLASRRRS